MLDEVGVRIVRALQQDGRASWTQVAEIADVPVTTAYRRGTALIENGDVLVAVVPETDIYPENSHTYELLLRCRPGTQRAVASRLAARTDTRWVAVITGEYGVAAELIIPRGENVAALLLDDIENDPDVIATQTALVLKTLAVAHDWQVPPARTATISADGKAPHHCDPSHLDESDRAILELLREDGRRSYTSVATELQMNETTVRRRCVEMLRMECARVVTLAQPHLLGYEQEVQIRLDVLPHEMESAMQMLAGSPGVHYVASTFGAMSLLCEIRLQSHHQLYDFVRDVVGQVPGLTKMTAEIELVVFKRAYVISPWAKGQARRPAETS